MTLGQIKTAAKSNEVTAIPELLETLDITGAAITMDAIGCQRKIVRHIVQREADYIIAVKNNQPTLAQAIEGLFDSGRDVRGELVQDTRVEKSHGRLHTRHCVAQADLSSLDLIKQDTATKGSIKLKRKRAGWNDDYMAHLLGLTPSP